MRTEIEIITNVVTLTAVPETYATILTVITVQPKFTARFLLQKSPPRLLIMPLTQLTTTTGVVQVQLIIKSKKVFLWMWIFLARSLQLSLNAWILRHIIHPEISLVGARRWGSNAIFLQGNSSGSIAFPGSDMVPPPLPLPL